MRGCKTRLVLGILLVGLLGLGGAHLYSQGAKDDEAAIKAVINSQVTCWNRGDIPGFMETYENSPKTTFIGKTLAKGYAPILERYKKAYTSKEQMGTLTFSDLEVRLLPHSSGSTEYAIVTGKYHLDRTEKGAATADDGIFSLVWHKSNGHWKILLDHTSS